MSRHITDLGEQNRYRTSGYELVEQRSTLTTGAIAVRT
jgi:hypothetical protein